MASVAAVVGATIGIIGGGAAAQRGVKTPGSELLSGVGVPGFAEAGPELSLPEVAEADKGIDQSAVRRARTEEAERQRQRRGRASTIQQRRGGLLAQAETTGGLLGS